MIVERRSDVTYRIRRESGNTATQVVNITRLKPVIPRPGVTEQIVFNTPIASDLAADDAERLGESLDLPSSAADRTKIIRQPAAAAPAPDVQPASAPLTAAASDAAATATPPSKKQRAEPGATEGAPRTRQRTTGRAATYTGMAEPDLPKKPRSKKEADQISDSGPVVTAASTRSLLHSSPAASHLSPHLRQAPADSAFLKKILSSALSFSFPPLSPRPTLPCLHTNVIQRGE